MQQNIYNNIQLGNTLNPLQDYGGVPSIDNKGIEAFWKTGKADEDLSRYIPNIFPITRQNQIAGTIPRKAFASVTYSNKKIIEFALELTAITYSNYSSMELVLPIQFTKKSTKTAQIDGDLITVNIFFGHCITDIDIRRYPDDARILPTNDNVVVYQFSNSQLKYFPKDPVATLLKSFLHSNKAVYLDANADRRLSYYTISISAAIQT